MGISSRAEQKEAAAAATSQTIIITIPSPISLLLFYIIEKSNYRREIRTRRKRGTPVEHPPTLIIQRALHTHRERERGTKDEAFFFKLGKMM